VIGSNASMNIVDDLYGGNDGVDDRSFSPINFPATLS